MAKLEKQNVPFTQIANEILNDPQISLKSKGLFAYLFSKPDSWNFRSERITEDSKDSRDAVRSGLKELEDAGYLERNKQPNGRMDYVLKYSKKPETENPSVAKSHSGEIRPISNKDAESNKEEDKKKVTAQSAEGTGAVIDLFKEVNPSYKILFSRKNQHDAAKRLLETHGWNRVSEMVKALPAILSMPYAPKPTTPLELERDLGKLKVFAEQKRNEKKTKVEQNKQKVGIII